MDGSSTEIAIRLLTVGMASVFTILGLVALTSRALILFTNRVVTSDNKTVYNEKSGPVSPENITNEEIAVIASAVYIATEGKGQIQSISK